MTIQACIDAALQLLNQYTIMGVPVPSTYNDQEDDKLRMINLINDAVMEIATNARPIISYVEFTVPDKNRNEPFKDLAIQTPEDYERATAV